MAGFAIRAFTASIISPRLCGGILVAIPTAIPDDPLTKRLGTEKVEAAAVEFERFEKYLRGAVDSSDPAQACIWLTQEFGNRFPNEPSWIKALSPREVIAVTPAIPGPSELVGRTKSA